MSDTPKTDEIKVNCYFVDCEDYVAMTELAQRFEREIAKFDAVKTRQGNPINWPCNMGKDDWASWLKDRSIMLDPYIQGPLMRQLACFIEDTPLFSAPIVADGLVQVPKELLEHWLEYWNGARTDSAMSNALDHILEGIQQVLQEERRKKLERVIAW